MTPRVLFYRRLRYEWKFQFRVFKTVIDWTVALYLVLPAIALIVYQYYEWWRAAPFWLAMMPAELFLLALVLFVWASPVRLFIAEGDQLFLLQRRHWIETLCALGIGYTVLTFVGTSLLFFTVLGPLAIISGRFALDDVWLLIPFTVLAKINVGVIRQFLQLRFHGWRGLGVKFGLFLVLAYLFLTFAGRMLADFKLYAAILAVLAVGAIGLSYVRVKHRGDFYADVERETSERLKYASLVIGLSGIKIRKRKKGKARPWLFPNSGNIFRKRTAVNALVELGIKSFWRSRQRVAQYFQLLGVMLLVIAAFPLNLKWLVWLIFGYIFSRFVDSFWAEVTGVESFALIRWKDEDQFNARQKFVLMMTLPAMAVMAAFANLSYIYPI